MHLHNNTCIAQCAVVSSVTTAVKGSEIVHANSVLTRVAAFAFIDVFNGKKETYFSTSCYRFM